MGCRLIDFGFVVLELLVYKVCGITGFSKIEFFNFSSNERFSGGRSTWCRRQGSNQRLMEGAVYQLMPTQQHQGFPNSVKRWRDFPRFLLGGKNLRRSDFDHWRRNLWYCESAEEKFFQVRGISKFLADGGNFPLSPQQGKPWASTNDLQEVTYMTILPLFLSICGVGWDNYAQRSFY